MRDQVEFLACSECLRETNQDVLHVLRDDDGKYERLTRCRGCEAAHLVTESNPGSKYDKFYILPKRIRQQPEWYFDLWLKYLGTNTKEEHLVDLIDEVYDALSAGSTRLAAMGVRALLETTMVSKVGDHGGFASNLIRFESEGYISPIQRDILSAALEVGHATIHRQHKPSVSDVSNLLDIAEGIVAAIYVHPDSSAKLADKLPPRRRPTKT